MEIRVAHLYPAYLNIYADRGNIAVLERRAGARGHELVVEPITLGSGSELGAYDLFYVGGGQDREQAMIAPDLAERGDAIRSAVDDGAALLAVCGGYQLLGRGYRGRDGSWMPGAALFPHETVAGDVRMIGDVLLESALPEAPHATIAGFENHAGRTLLDEGARPWAASSPGTGTTASRDTRERVSAGQSGRTSTDRSCLETRGSPTCCSRGRSRTPRETSRLRSSRWRTSSSARRTPSPPPARVRAAVGPLSFSLFGPARPEVDARVARLPALQEPCDRGVERDAVELLDPEEPVAAHCLVRRGDVYERAVELTGEHDVDDVLRPDAALGGDRLDDRDRPLDRQLLVLPDETRLLGQLSVQRLDERLAAPDAPARKEPVLAAALLVATEEDRAVPSQHGGDADPRLRPHQAPDEPRPPSPRSLAGSSSTSTSSTDGSSTITSCAIRIPGSTTNGSVRSVLRRMTLTSPR